MDPLRLLRMARWARHPPPLWKAVVFVVVLGLALGLVGLEHLGLWPDWARASGPLRLHKP